VIVYGLDFTSDPRLRKPITLAVCDLEDGVLSVRDFRRLPSFEAFETFLASDGPWIVGIDFPFGQPRKLIENLGWPRTWEGYVRVVHAMGKAEFEETLARYRAPRPEGDKQHLREVDIRANSRSPMMLAGVPVGKMFFQGAPRLLASGASILPFRYAGDRRVVVEAYPALVARKWIGARSYKTDTKPKQTPEKETARRDILTGLLSPQLREHYEFSVALPEEAVDQLVRDPTADELDALLCAVQAGWAYSRRSEGYGIPAECDMLEGWIVDPGMQPRSAGGRSATPSGADQLNDAGRARRASAESRVLQRSGESRARERLVGQDRSILNARVRYERLLRPRWARFDDSLIMVFFFAYSRFEYALKRAGFLYHERRYAEANWEKFGVEIEQAYERAKRTRGLDDAIRYLLDHPPMRQVRNADGTLGWENRRRNGQKEVVWLLNLVKGVRHNLFHGGKFLYDPARDDRLLRCSMIVLAACLELHSTVRQFYERLDA
jgi:hypothetical protein